MLAGQLALVDPSPGPGRVEPSVDRRTGPGAPCWWCERPIPEFSVETGRRTRKDKKRCSKRCRQGSWRFGMPAAPAVAVAGPARRFAYADPPYPGMAERYYGDHADYAGEVDHQALVEQLLDEYRDGWALSTSSKTLRYVLGLLPASVEHRIGAWTRPAPPTKVRHRRVAWEPVIFVGGRPRPAGAPMVLDWVHAAPPRRLPKQVTGAKPGKFCFWLFDMLCAQPGDQLDDLFPGSGAVGRAWERYASLPAGAVAQDLDDASPVDRAAA